MKHLGNTGDPIDSKCGFMQGGILSPKLFNEFLYDLLTYLNESNGIKINDLSFTHLLYADDIVLVADCETSLQNNINALHEFCRKWHLIVNVGKTNVMKIGDNSQHQFCYNEKLIENVETFKYLGHILTNKRNIHSKMGKYFATQAQKALFALQGDTKHSLGYITPKLAMKMFDTYILPILEYNCETWSNVKPIDDIEKIQIGYLKNMLGIR